MAKIESVQFHLKKTGNRSGNKSIMAARCAQVTEVPGSHAIYVSKPAEIAELIQQAADARA